MKTPITSTPPGVAPTDPETPKFGTGVARGAALFLGLFTLLNLAIAVRHPIYNANIWWILLAPLPQKLPAFIMQTALLYMCLVWLAYAFVPIMPDWRRRVTRTSIELLALPVAWNVLNYYGSLLRGTTRSMLPIPFSAFVLLLLWLIWRGSRSDRSARGPSAWIVMAVTTIVLVFVTPLLQILLYGLVDYRGVLNGLAADAAIVLGGSTAAQASESIKIAADLVDKKLAQAIVLSGTPAEVETMRESAVAAGVPEDEIHVSEEGGPLEAIVEGANKVLMGRDNTSDHPGKATAILIGEFSQLPRIRMNFAREERDVPTIPLRSAGFGGVMKEVGALWKYYFDAASRQQ